MSKKFRAILLISSLVLALTFVSVVAAQRNGNGDTNPPPNRGTAQSQNNAQNQSNPQIQNGIQNQARSGDCTQLGMMNQNHHGMQIGMMNQQGDCIFADVLVDADLSQVEIDAMVAGLLDEYHAYDTYAAIIAQFGDVQPFVNIMNAESSHIAAWERIFARYDVDLPERPTVDVPAFRLLADACAVATEAEIANASLYDDMLATLAAYPDMVQVVTNLQSASLNSHLPAFQQCSN